MILNIRTYRRSFKMKVRKIGLEITELIQNISVVERTHNQIVIFNSSSSLPSNGSLISRYGVGEGEDGVLHVYASIPTRKLEYEYIVEGYRRKFENEIYSKLRITPKRFFELAKKLFSKKESSCKLYLDFEHIQSLDIPNLKSVMIRLKDENNLDLNTWDVEIMSPRGSHYEGGVFHFVININEGYPENGISSVKHVTKIFHPLACPETEACSMIDNLKWSVHKRVFDVIGLLTHNLENVFCSKRISKSKHNENDRELILNKEAFELIDKDEQLFSVKARDWTLKFASEKLWLDVDLNDRVSYCCDHMEIFIVSIWSRFEISVPKLFMLL